MDAFRFDFVAEKGDFRRGTTRQNDAPKRDGISNGNRVRRDAVEHQFDCKSPVFRALLSRSVGLTAYTVGKTRCQSVKMAYLNRGDLEKWCRVNTDDSSVVAMSLRNLLDFTNAEHSDLIPGVYEGGLKIWECTFDLMQVIVEEPSLVEGKRVLDLGCGAGLVGTVALLKGAKTVDFQDYNSEVIENLTIANVAVNVAKNGGSGLECDMLFKAGEEIQKKCRFFSGDWSNIHSLISRSPNYDIVLTSETIYSLTSQQILLQLLKDCLATEGCILVAAKTHYFGVGGSLEQFGELLASDGTFECQKRWNFADSVPRQVLKLTRACSNDLERTENGR